MNTIKISAYLPKYHGKNFNEAMKVYKGAGIIEGFKGYEDYLREILTGDAYNNIDILVPSTTPFSNDEIDLYVEAIKEGIDFRLLINPYYIYSMSAQEIIFSTLKRYKCIANDLITNFNPNNVSPEYLNLIQVGLLQGFNVLYAFKEDCTLGELSFLLGYQLYFQREIKYNIDTNTFKIFLCNEECEDKYDCITVDDGRLSFHLEKYINNLNINSNKKSSLNNLIKHDYDVSKYMTTKHMGYYHVIFDKLCRNKNVFVPQDTLLSFNNEELKDLIESRKYGTSVYLDKKDEQIRNLETKIKILKQI